MDSSPDAMAEKLASGETDRVNAAIDGIEAVEASECLDRFDDLLDACRPLMESEDGYVRQSVVRFLRAAYPLAEIRIAASEVGSVGGYTLEDIANHRARLVDIYLTALDDEDGRVRRAAVRGFNALAVALDMAGQEAEIRALIETLDDLVKDLPDQRATHAERARASILRTGLISSVLDADEQR